MAICIKDFPSLIPREFQRWFDDERSADCLAWADVPEKTIDPDNKRVAFVASDDSVDLDDEVIAAGAFHELRGGYLGNPAILSAHQHVLANGHPAAIAKAIQMDTERNPLVCVAQFGEHEASQQNWLAYRHGIQKAFSVGFRSRETEKRNGKRTHTKALLLEISTVAVPCNPHALVCDYVRGHLADEARRTSDRGLADEALAAVRELAAKLDLMERRFDPSKSIEESRDSGLGSLAPSPEPRSSGQLREMELRLARLEESFAGDDPVVKDWKEKLSVAEHLGRVVESVEARFRS
jgi:HK97 family phage prohead protease